MKVVYIVGPYRGQFMLDNITNAAKYAHEYWTMGYAVICPHMNSAFFDFRHPSIPDETYLEGYKELLRRADVIVVLPKWKKSEGSMEEVILARVLNKEIIFISL